MLGSQGGFVNVQAGLNADSDDFPTVQALVNGGFVQAGSTITISATHGGPPPSLSDGTVAGVSGNTLVFNGQTGLSTGASVTYEPPPGSGSSDLIGGLVGGATYGVIVTGPDTLELGTQFTFGQTASVSTAQATLQFDAPDNLHTGDVVTYNPGSGTPIQAFIGGTEQNLPAGNYTVTVVGPETIRLSNASTPTASATFNPGSVVGSSNYIFDIGGFSQNEAVTYTAPQTAEFDGAGNVQNNEITIPEGYTFSSGDQVEYLCATGNCASIGGLAFGTSYDVIAVNGTTLQLAALSAPSTALALSAGSGTQELVPVGGISGLTSGDTYYVNVTGSNQFDLMAAPCTSSTVGLRGHGAHRRRARRSRRNRHARRRGHPAAGLRHRHPGAGRRPQSGAEPRAENDDRCRRRAGSARQRRQRCPVCFLLGGRRRFRQRSEREFIR